MKVAPGWSGKYRLSILMGLPFASRKSEGLMIGLYGVLHRSAAPAIGAVPIKEATATTPREWFVSTGHGRRWWLGISDSSLRCRVVVLRAIHARAGRGLARVRVLPRLAGPCATKFTPGSGRHRGTESTGR